jgi:hypothetical protein
MPLTDEQRENIVKVAESWYGTPYRDCSAFKGPKGGVDCGQLIKAVFIEAGHRPADGIPVPQTYSTSVWQHKNDTTYIDTVEKYMREISESEVKAGDVVLYKMGRAFAHAAIIKIWPEHIIHCLSQIAGGVVGGHGGNGQFSRNLKFSGMVKKFFTLKDEWCEVKK